MNLRKIFLTIVAILLFITAVNAAEIDVSHKLLTDTVYPGEAARINLIITNNQETDDYFKIEPNPLEMYPLLSFSAFKDVIPPIRSQVDINAHREVILPFDIYVMEDIEPDRRYTLNFNIKSGTNKEIKVKYPIAIDVNSPEDLVKITTDMPKEVTPGKETIFSVTFKNQANMLVDPIELYIDSELFSKQYTEKLYQSPYEVKKTLKFTPDPTVKPGKYKVGIRAYKGKTLRGKLVKTIEIKANPDIISKIETESGFLTRTIVVTKTNIGNVPVEERYELPITGFQKLMTSYGKEPQKITSGKVEWIFTVKPGSDYILKIQTDYRILFFTLIGIFIASIAIIYYIRRGVSIKKGIFKIKDEKGAITELKVMIHLVNRTSKPIKNIKLIDIVPNILKLEKEFGTLNPSKTQKGANSNRLIWDIEELEPKEERIISYKAKLGLHIIGKILLPPALFRYKDKNHKVIDQKSNHIVLFSATQKKDSD